MKNNLVLVFFSLCLWLTKVIASESKAKPEECKNIKEFCEKKTYGFSDDRSFGDIQIVWTAIRNHALSQSTVDGDFFSITIEMVFRVKKQYLAAMKKVAKLPPPRRNVFVEGMIMSGMEPEQVQDVRIRERYKKMLLLNQQSVDANNDMQELRRLYEGILYDLNSVFLKGNRVNKDDRMKMEDIIKEGLPSIK